ncbi:MAG: hypothetical protein LBC89_05135 [Bacteroidales bacterium]|jgi:hypothetical protein|nr:hypothetical protein [Bacteroidales bacterium]
MIDISEPWGSTQMVLTLLKLLKKHKPNRKYSSEDFLQFPAEVKKVKINDRYRWCDAERTRKTTDLINKLGMQPVTYNEKC